jgi:serine/threonine-protein kinase
MDASDGTGNARRRGMLGRHAATLPPALAAKQDNNILGPYRLLSLLASGGTSKIYLAEHVDTQERYALKLLDPSYQRRADMIALFMRERDVANAVVHPGLVAVREVDVNRCGTPFLVMELLDGTSLGRLLERERVSIAAAGSIGEQVAAALTAMHRAGYVHSDIKADNIMVLHDELINGWPRIKVIDYGIARHIDEPATEGLIYGTPAYMPPEQWSGMPGPKSDIYALGCLLYELIIGEQPFQGSLPQLLTMHVEHLPQRPSFLRYDVPPALDALVMRMLAKDPAMRPSTFEVETTLGLLVTDRYSPAAESAA